MSSSSRVKALKRYDRSCRWIELKRKLLKPLYLATDLIHHMQALAAWAPVIWNDRDWDHSFLFVIISFKLRRMHHHLRYEGVAVHKKEDLEAIIKAAKACDRLSDEGRYGDPYHKEHDRKWGRFKYKMVPSDLDEKGKPLTYSFDSWRPRAKTKKQKELERKEYLRIWDKMDMDRRSDVQVLAAILEDHSTSWWD